MNESEKKTSGPIGSNRAGITVEEWAKGSPDIESKTGLGVMPSTAGELTVSLGTESKFRVVVEGIGDRVFVVDLASIVEAVVAASEADKPIENDNVG